MPHGNGSVEPIGALPAADPDSVTLTVQTNRTDRHIRLDFSQPLTGFTLSRRGAEGLVHLLESALDRLGEEA